MLRDFYHHPEENAQQNAKNELLTRRVSQQTNIQHQDRISNKMTDFVIADH